MPDNDFSRGQHVSLTGNASLANPPTRQSLSTGGRHGHNTQLWDAVSYPTERELTFNTYLTRYKRTAEAHGIIDKFAEDTWQDLPEIRDGADTSDDDGQTEFEQQVEQLFGRQGLRGSPKQWFKNAHKMAMLGEYSVILLGFNDGRPLSEPVAGLETDAPDDPADVDTDDRVTGPDTDPTPSLEGLDALNYVAVYDQGRVDNLEEETDPTHPRFRLPKEYQIEVADRDVKTVHWTRTIHVPQGVFDDPLRGTPFLKPIFHELLNIDKIKAAGAEGYWRGAYQGLVARPPQGKDGSRISPDSMQGDASDLANQIEQYTQNFDRFITTTADIDTLGADVTDPMPQYETQFRAIATDKDAPMSILMGNETGERATSEDKAMWHEKIAGIRNSFAAPVILRAFLDRLIDVGVLPEPAHQENDYDEEWPPLDEPSEKERAEIAKLWLEALDAGTGGQPDLLVAFEEMRQEFLDLKPEYGSMVESDDIRPLPELDESDPAVQEQFTQLESDLEAATDGGQETDE